MRGNLVLPAPLGATLARTQRQRQGRRRATLPCYDQTFKPGRTSLPPAARPRLRPGREGVPACQPGAGPRFPVLPPGATPCRGRSLSRVCAKRSGATRRPQAVVPWTAGFRGDKIARRARTARQLWQCGQRVRDGGDRRAAGAGERRCGGGPRRASPTLRQRAGPPPSSGETPRQPCPPTAGALAWPVLPPVNPGLCPERGRVARTPKRAFQPWRKVASRGRTSTGAPAVRHRYALLRGAALVSSGRI